MSARIRDAAGRMVAEDAMARFWRNVRKADGCWEWTAGRTQGGYGSFNEAGGRFVRAHRFAYAQLVGPIAAGLFVCHRCDNRLCVRPDHLFLGTNKDNADDRDRKGRNVVPVGERQGSARLTDDLVRWIRAEWKQGRSAGSIAKDLGLSRSPVWQAATGKSWRHVK